MTPRSPTRRRALPLLIGALLALAWLPAASQSAAAGPESSNRPDFAAAVRRVEAAVVSIETASDATSGADPDVVAQRYAVPPSGPGPGLALEPGAAGRRPGSARGLASGFIIGADGAIITNAHAVADVDRASVRLADGRRYVGRVIGLDRGSDVALLQIDARDLPVAAIAPNARVAAGEWVVAIGSPFGLDRSVTAGIVSAVQRDLPGSAVPLIQTDVAINPGSSGGPLFNARGDVVGVNSMVFSLTGGYMGVSFAVPIDVALRIAAELRATGRVTRGQLGAKIQELTPELARAFGLSAPAGALVLRVVAGSPAERSGLRSGDVVLGFDGRSDIAYAELQRQVAAARPGQPMALSVWRHGALQRVALTVGEAPADRPAPPLREPTGRDERLGLNLGELTPPRRGDLGIDGGLPVREAHGAAAQGGVRADDVIVAIGDRPVRTLAEFDAALAALRADRPIALLVLRRGVWAYLAIEAGR